MERTKETLKELIRAGRAKVPAHKVIKGGQLVNVMSSEIYPADVAVYNDMIVAVGDVEDYIGSETEIIDATGYYLTPGMIDGHIHSDNYFYYKNDETSHFFRKILPNYSHLL